MAADVFGRREVRAIVFLRLEDYNITSRKEQEKQGK